MHHVDDRVIVLPIPSSCRILPSVGYGVTMQKIVRRQIISLRNRDLCTTESGYRISPVSSWSPASSSSSSSSSLFYHRFAIVLWMMLIVLSKTHASSWQLSIGRSRADINMAWEGTIQIPEEQKQMLLNIQKAWNRQRRKWRNRNGDGKSKTETTEESKCNDEDADGDNEDDDEEENIFNLSHKLNSIANSVRESNSSDQFAEGFANIVGWIVIFQMLGTVFKSNQNEIVKELASLLLNPETVEAMKSIRGILSNFHDEHGVIDVFGKYKKQDVLVSIFALSRLQRTAIQHEQRLSREADSRLINMQTEPELLNDLAHYAVYANAAYGWKMDFATRLRIHTGGNLQALLRQTGIDADDVILAEWESKAHRPAYFVVRDHNHKSIVLCVRGTWSPQDLLTDLCCTPRALDDDCSSWKTSRSQTWSSRFPDRCQRRQIFGHHGMLEAAKALQRDSEILLDHELKENPGFKLVLVGHSMGGGVAALLGTLLEQKYPRLQVYVYGPPCVSPDPANLHPNIVSIVTEGDPFCCLSLGHIADISSALDILCKDPMLRSDVLMRTNAELHEMDDKDLEWCLQTMEKLRMDMNAEKLYPPGRVLVLQGASSLILSKHKRTENRLRLREVSHSYFQDLVVGPRMLDLSRHIPSMYVSALRQLTANP